MSDVHVWFLRGINVGGAHGLRMAVLRDHLGELGVADVKTYIQSGNVVFRAPDRVAAALPELFEEEARARYGFAVPVVARPAAALTAIVANNPFLAAVDDHAAVDHKRYHLGLFRESPPPQLVSALEPAAYQPDDFVMTGREIYFDLPAGVAESKLLTSKGFGKLWAGMTLRNWRTVAKTLALAAEVGAG